MKKHSMPEMKESGVNVTPLIDVVMCLIIFFMLVAKIGVSTGAQAMELPETIVGMKIEKLGDNLVVNVMDPNPEVVDPATGKPVVDDKGRKRRRRGAGAVDEPIVTAMLDQLKDKGQAKEIKLRGAAPGDYPFRRVLEARVKGDPKRGIKPSPDFAVTVRAERDLEFRMLQQVLAEIASAGVKTVNYGSVGRKSAGDAAAAPAAK